MGVFQCESLELFSVVRARARLNLLGYVFRVPGVSSTCEIYNFVAQSWFAPTEYALRPLEPAHCVTGNPMRMALAAYRHVLRSTRIAFQGPSAFSAQYLFEQRRSQNCVIPHAE